MHDDTHSPGAAAFLAALVLAAVALGFLIVWVGVGLG
jgi:hypothetical protein